MKHIHVTLLAALCAVSGFFSTFAASSDSDRDFSQLEKQFKGAPMETRRLTGPLFWLHGDETKERLETYIQKIAEGGNGSFTAESRPHVDWLGEGWYRDLSICLESAKKHGLQMWIFDEKMWPSQAVDGKVPSRYAAKRLDAAVAEIEGPKLFEADGYTGETYIASVAGRVTANGKIEGDTLVDIGPNIDNGKLTWQVPEGKWRIIKFTYKTAPALIQSGGRQLTVDGASKDCVDWFIKTVYQPHYDRFKEDFGKTIAGYFYDEPEAPGDWGTDLNFVLAEWNVDWKKAYVGYKFELVGEEQLAAKFQYLDAFAEAWGRTMYGGMSEWCRQRGVQSIGHFMEHGNLYRHPEFSAGDMVRLQKYSDMGGIDAVFDQFVMGKRVTRDAPCWQTPKLGSSISHAYGKSNDVTMVEIFGARGQDLTYPEMKWWADHMHVSGVNFLIPHSFNPRSPHDTDCPPYFYNGGFEPRWPLYRVFADYTSRLSLMLTGGRHVCPVALLYFGQSHRLGQYIPPEQISEALQDALYDCDWLPYEVLENDMTVVGNELKLRNESYKILIIPPVEVIPYPTLAKAKRFFDNGGVVVAHGFLPSKSATLGKNSQDIKQLCDAIWGSAQTGVAACKTSATGGRSYLLPAQPTPEQLALALSKDAKLPPTLEVLEGKTDNWLHVLHRVKEGRNIFFVANQNHTGGARQFRFRITAEGTPECWDPMRNEITAIPFTRDGKHVELSLTMEPNESVLLVFQPVKRSLPMRLEPRRTSASDLTVVPVVRDSAPAQPELKLDGGAAALALKDCSWVWYPEGKTTETAAPGTRYFRRQVTIPTDRRVTKVTFFGTADNSFTLWVNGKDAGQSDSSAEGWRNPVELDVTKLIHKGTNQFAIAAVNGGNKPNPAGLIGQLVIEFDRGAAAKQPVDKSWKTSKDENKDWLAATLDDSGWVSAQEILPFGGQPWGLLAGRLTLSPAKADPFHGHFTLTKANCKNSRIYLEMDDLKPEAAARITINDKDAGGLIGKPLRIEVSRFLKVGNNTIRIEPFAPKSVKLTAIP